ncbi:MAG: hypothetical protein MMC33_008215 [Icmadophila ericetorum]|nr:hypothetical protein [Icmadophila ericetorum]
MPIPMVLRLQLPLKQKIAVLGMFFLGAIVIALSITRLSFYIHVASVFAAHYADETYYTSPVFFWINIELALGVVASCLPTLRPIWLQLKPPSPTSKGSMQLSSYSGFSSRYSKKHHRMSDTQDDHDNINLTSTSTVDTHIQAGPQHPPRQLDEHVINVEQQMSTESRRLGNAV